MSATINNVVLADNAYGTLASGLAVGDTTLTWTTGHGARFPAVTGSQVLYCVLLNNTNVLEEVIITAHTASADTATITRAAGGTTAKVWNAGDRVEARVSSSSLNAASAAGMVAAGGDLIYGSAAGVLAKLTIGALGTRLHSTGTAPEWQATWFKVVATTRDLSTASGTQAITGAGFTPKAAILLVGSGGSAYSSIGIDDGTTHACSYFNHSNAADTMGFNAANSIYMEGGGGATDIAYVSAWGADGCTLTWTRAGSPTGTVQVVILFFR